MTPRPARVGCSGWNYASWRATFYPPRLPARRWLEHYATRFDTVEVNATFYLTTDWTYLRFHYGHRGHRGNYSERELREWAARVRGLTKSTEVFAYFNNDWEVFAPRNAERLQKLVARG